MILAVPVAGKQKSVDICKAFIDGSPRKPFGYVFYGVNESNAKQWRIVMASGEPWFYIDNSYFDSARGKQYRVTKGRVQIDPRGVKSDGKRFDALGLTIAPMNARPSDLWIVVEQSPSFMRYVANDEHWLEQQMAGIPGGHHVKVRRWSSDKPKQQETLPADLAGAWTLVTHSSAAAVTAALLGVPAIVSPMSALYSMRWSTATEHDERRDYLNVLADNQWTLDEIRAGKAWEWLNK
jgi:hypothetical protein